MYSSLLVIKVIRVVEGVHLGLGIEGSKRLSRQPLYEFIVIGLKDQDCSRPALQVGGREVVASAVVCKELILADQPGLCYVG